MFEVYQARAEKYRIAAPASPKATSPAIFHSTGIGFSSSSVFKRFGSGVGVGGGKGPNGWFLNSGPAGCGGGNGVDEAASRFGLIRIRKSHANRPDLAPNKCILLRMS